MTPEQLKKSIIYQAVSGKLTSQQKSDGSGLDFLKQIQTEKKKSKLKHRNLTTDLCETPFNVPSNWIWSSFGNVVNYRMGKTPPRGDPQYWGGEINWVSIADMIDNGFIKSTKESVTKTALNEKFGGFISKAGTLLMSFKLTVGRVSILDIDAVHNEAIISIYPIFDNDEIFKKYLFYILPFISSYGESKKVIKGRTLNSTSLSNLPIPLPPLEEQKRIVTKIEELLPLVDKYEEAWAKLEKFNNQFPDNIVFSILKSAFERKLFNNCENNKKWKSCLIEDLVKIIPSKQYQILESEVKPEGKYIVISQSKDYSIGFCDDDTKACKEDSPVIVFGDHTTEIKIVNEPFVVGADGVKLFSPIKEIVDYKFLYYQLLYNCKDLSQLGGYSRHYKYLKEKKFILPPLEEQKRIVSKIEEILPLCRSLK